MPTATPLRLVPAPEPLASCVAPGRLVELSAPAGGAQARTTTAVRLLVHAQARGETTAWIQPEGGPLFPPDLAANGVDLAALVVVHVPPHRLCKAAEMLLRSGALGFVVVDLCDATPPEGEAWQGRLLGLARQHESLVVLLTQKPTHADSLGTLVGLRIESRLVHAAPDEFVIEHHVLKNKSGAPLRVAPEPVRGPAGLR